MGGSRHVGARHASPAGSREGIERDRPEAAATETNPTPAAGSARARHASPLQTAPLVGTRVLELGVVLAGPQAGLLLADLGAEVIRVESTRYFPPQTRGIFARPSR